MISNSQTQNFEGKNSCGKILYRIKNGDTLSGIALSFGCDINKIATLNNIVNHDLIYAGSILQIPNCR